MIDQFGRNIDYMRLSLTERCNLRCQYCMPQGARREAEEDVLRYEELLRVCTAAAALGITRFKLTGGEPLVRPGCAAFAKSLKALPGVEQVTLTTNGLLLGEKLDALAAAGLDGVNISLDTLDADKYRAITGSRVFTPAEIFKLLGDCCARGIKTKLNCVLLPENREEAVSLAAIAQQLPVDVRFIELMPIGFGGALEHIDPDAVLDSLRQRWTDLHPTAEKRGNGPAVYYASEQLRGRVGFIDAVSHRFCESCNRVRLTSGGRLKPCLCYADTLDLKALLRGGCTEGELLAALRKAIYEKPRAHCFERRGEITESRLMGEIGG